MESLPVGIQAAIITASATVIAAISVLILKKFYFDVQSRLRVVVRPATFKSSAAMKKKVEGLLDPVPYLSPLRIQLNAGGYTTVTVTNISKKKISAVTVTVPYSSLMMAWQIDDAEEINVVETGQPIGIGDIQPQHSRVIHIWSNVDISQFHFSHVKRLLRISADELDSVSRRFPAKYYLWKKYEDRLFIAIVLFSAASLFFSISLEIYFHKSP